MRERSSLGGGCRYEELYSRHRECCGRMLYVIPICIYCAMLGCVPVVFHIPSIISSSLGWEEVISVNGRVASHLKSFCKYDRYSHLLGILNSLF